MAENFDDMSPDIYTLVDEEGVEQTFEKIDEMDVGDDHYYAFVPYYDDPSEELGADTELVVLKSEYVDGEENLVSIDDDDEYEKVGNMFLERLNDLYEE